jgi:HAE1 family hydrophobic/amphiphilic exporter-1
VNFLAIVLLAAATVPSPAPQPQLPAVPAVAPGYAAPAVSPPPPGVVGVTQQPFVGITLENAIGLALTHNPDLAVAQANRRIATYQIQAAKGAYDVQFSVEPQYQYTTQPPQNQFFSGPNFTPIVQRNAQVNAGVQGILPGGQQYSVTASGAQTYNNTQINTFNPTYPTLFSVNFSQPLSKSGRENPASHQLQLARINSQASDAQTLVQASATIAQVQKTYWDLVAAWREVAIQEQALKDTITQQHSNVRMARQGVTAPIDVVQANTQIAVFQENVFSALQAVANLQNLLKSELMANPNDPLWSANLVPTTPVLQLPSESSLAVLVTEALKSRPEISQIRSLRASADENLAFAENQTKPQFNVNVGYTSNGFAGTVLPLSSSPFLQSSFQQFVAINQLIAAVNRTLPPAEQIPALPNTNVPVPSYLQGGLDQSIKNLLSNKFPLYAAGIQVTFPIGNTTAKADLAAAEEQERSVTVQEASTIQRITMDVRNALQAFQSAQVRLLAARAAREASEQVLASEQRRFRAGASTTYLVLQREIELADNRGRELQAQTDLNKAVVDLQQATGTILTANNVTVTNVGEGALKP